MYGVMNKFQKAGKYTAIKPKGGETFEVYEELSNKFPLLEKYKQTFYEAYPNAPEDVANSVAIAAMHKFFPDSNVKKEFLTKMGGGDYYRGYALYNEFINSSKNQFGFLDMGTHHSTKADAELTSASEQDIFNRFYTDVEEIPEQRKKTKVRLDTNYEPLLLSSSIPDKNYKSGKRGVILGRTQLIRDDEKAREFERRIQEEVLNKENIPLTIKVSKNKKPLFKDDDPYYATYYYPDGYEEDKVAEVFNNFGGITGLRDKIKGVYNDMFPNEMEGYEITPAQKVEKFKFKKRDVTATDESKKQFGGLNNTNMKKKLSYQKSGLLMDSLVDVPDYYETDDDSEKARMLIEAYDRELKDAIERTKRAKGSKYGNKNAEARLKKLLDMREKIASLGDEYAMAMSKYDQSNKSLYNDIMDLMEMGYSSDRYASQLSKENKKEKAFEERIAYGMGNPKSKGKVSKEDRYTYLGDIEPIEVMPSEEQMAEIRKMRQQKSKPNINNVSTKDLWESLTGTSWSQAKEQGLTDGSYDMNIALRKQLIMDNMDKIKQMYSNVPSMAKGGKVYGASHQEGGVPAVDEDTGEQVAEVEGGERIFSREDTQQIEQMAYNILQAQSEEEASQMAMELGFLVAQMVAEQDMRANETTEAMPTAMSGMSLKNRKKLMQLNSY